MWSGQNYDNKVFKNPPKYGSETKSPLTGRLAEENSRDPLEIQIAH
jgi:hypothetical protein